MLTYIEGDKDKRFLCESLDNVTWHGFEFSLKGPNTKD